MVYSALTSFKDSCANCFSSTPYHWDHQDHSRTMSQNFIRDARNFYGNTSFCNTVSSYVESKTILASTWHLNIQTNEERWNQSLKPAHDYGDPDQNKGRYYKRLAKLITYTVIGPVLIGTHKLAFNRVVYNTDDSSSGNNEVWNQPTLESAWMLLTGIALTGSIPIVACCYRPSIRPHYYTESSNLFMSPNDVGLRVVNEREEVIVDGLLHFLPYCPEYLLLMNEDGFNPSFLSNIMISSIMAYNLKKEEEAKTERDLEANHTTLMPLLENGQVYEAFPFWEDHQVEVKTLLSSYQSLSKSEKMSLHSLLIDGRRLTHLDGPLTENLLKTALVFKGFQKRLIYEIANEPILWKSAQKRIYSFVCDHIETIWCHSWKVNLINESGYTHLVEAIRYSLIQPARVRHEQIHQQISEHNLFNRNRDFLADILSQTFLKNEEGELDSQKVLEFFSNSADVAYFILARKTLSYQIIKHGQESLPKDLLSEAFFKDVGEPLSESQSYSGLSVNDKKEFERAFFHEGASISDHGKAWYPLYTLANTYFGRISDNKIYKNDYEHFHQVLSGALSRILEDNNERFNAIIKQKLIESYSLSNQEGVVDLEKCSRCLLHLYFKESILPEGIFDEEAQQALSIIGLKRMRLSEDELSLLDTSIIEGQKSMELIDSGEEVFDLVMTLVNKPEIKAFVEKLFLDSPSGSSSLEDARSNSSNPDIPEGYLQEIMKPLTENRSLYEQSQILRALFSGYRGEALPEGSIDLLDRMEVLASRIFQNASVLVDEAAGVGS